jgi:hypothetical protein
MAVPADFLQRRISGKSTRKPPKKSPAQFTGNAFSLITNVMLNREGFLGFVILKEREKKVKAWHRWGTNYLD